MSISEKASVKVTQYLSNNLEKSEEDMEKIQYGIQVIFINLFKLIILFVSAYFLNILTYTAIAFIAFAFIRMFSCGVHANSSFKCVIINYIVFWGNVYLSIYVDLNRIAIAGIFALSIILYYLYAPADTAERPLVSKKLRKQLKIKSVIVATSIGIVCVIMPSSIYISLITFSILEESFFITPFAYWLFKKPYRNYLNVEL